MKRKDKERIEARLCSADVALREVWAMTSDYTPEDAIVQGMLGSLNALFRIINRVKVED